MKRFEVKGGLGRLSQFPKTIIVETKDEKTAISIGMYEIRQLITEQDFNGDSKAPMLNKIISIDDVKELE
jgi:hypothetical protein